MAKRTNGGNESDFSIFGSDESIERQTQMYERMGKDVADHVMKYMEDRAKRMSDNLNKEFKDGQSLVAEALKAREEHNKNTESTATWKERATAGVISQAGSGQKFDPSWKNFFKTAGKELVKTLESAFSIYITKPIQSGFDNMSSAFEGNFTNIAGRMGTNQKQTYLVMKEAVSTLNSSYAKSAINANKELIPKLNEVANKGWKGSEAVSVALTNTVDSKIMPWLDYSSEAWNNLQFNLSDSQIKTLKAQQLLLQETKSGNRLLQTGVVNSLINDLQPLLSNIDYNTMDYSKLSEEAQKSISALVETGHYTEREAYDAYNQALQVYKNPASALSRGDYSGVMQFQAAYNGETPLGIMTSDIYGKQLAADSGKNASIIAQQLGLSSISGVYRADAFQRDVAAISAAEEEGRTSQEVSTNIYDQAATNVDQKVTKTTAWDNRIENTVTASMYWSNDHAHGPEMLRTINKSLGNILKALISMGIGKLTLGILKGNPSTTSNLGGLASKTSNFSKIGKSAVSSMAGSKLGAQLIKSGSAMLGKSGSAGSLLKGAGLATTGIALTAANTSEAVKDFKGGNTKGGLLSLGGAAAGAVGVAGILAGSGPVGWAGLLISGGVLAGKKLYQLSKDADKSGKAIRDSAKQASDAQLEQQKTLKESITSIAKQLTDGEITVKDENDARKLLVDNGLMTSTDAQKANADELKKLTLAYLSATKDFETDADKKARKAATSGAEKAAKKNSDKLDEFFDISGTETRMRQQYIEDNGLESLSKSGKDLAVGMAMREGKLNVNYSDPKSKQQIDYISNLVGTIGTEEDKKQWDKVSKNKETEGVSIGDLSYFANKYAKAKQSDKLVAAQLSDIDLSKAGIKSEVEISADYNNYVDAAKDLNTAYQTYSSAGELDNNKQSLLDKIINLSKYDVDKETRTKVKDQYEYVKTAYNYLKGDKDFANKLPEKYAVGTPYVKNDQLAMIHKGEAIIPASENTTRLRKLFGFETDNKQTNTISSEDIVNAIMDQTSDLKAAIKEIVNSLQSSGGGISYTPLKVGRDLTNMDSRYGNIRPVQ